METDNHCELADMPPVGVNSSTVRELSRDASMDGTQSTMKCVLQLRRVNEVVIFFQDVQFRWLWNGMNDVYEMFGDSSLMLNEHGE